MNALCDDGVFRQTLSSIDTVDYLSINTSFMEETPVEFTTKEWLMIKKKNIARLVLSQNIDQSDSYDSEEYYNGSHKMTFY